MKGLVVLLALLLLVPAVAVPDASMQTEQSVQQFWMPPGDESADPYFMPGDMSLEDDGFHEERGLHAETWYYEALFDGRSMVFIVSVLSLPDGRTGMAMAGLYLYRQGQLIATERHTTASFTAALNRPYITLDDTPVIEGDLDQEGDLVYDVSFTRNGIGVELRFVNQSKGWMGDMGRGWWLAVPELQVTGTMTLDGRSHAVTGTGYHDHNVFSLLNPLLERGYLDGKMTAVQFSLVWGHILESRLKTHSFAIVSEDGGYLGLGPDAVDISFASYTWDNGTRIPTTCTITIDDPTHGITGTIWMNATAMHHIRLPLLRYWRYHVEVTGWLQSPSHHEVLDERGMMEYMLY
ncbi:MAG: hypothetical protein ACP5FL_02380 [Thermoplasmatota archaeon]